MAKAFRVIGSTDDVTQCDLCGRDELKGTVVLAELDADGIELGYCYYGSSCAANAAGMTLKNVHTQTRNADRARRQAEADERRQAEEQKQAVYHAWIAEHVGADAWDNANKYGYGSPFRLLRAAIAAVGM